MKIGKIICCAALGALALSAIPYQFKNDEETGAVEIRSLLWGWRRTSTPTVTAWNQAHLPAHSLTPRGRRSCSSGSTALGSLPWV